MLMMDGGEYIFEESVKWMVEHIVENIRNDRQFVVFVVTSRSEVKHWSYKYMTKHVQIAIGVAASAHVTAIHMFLNGVLLITVLYIVSDDGSTKKKKYIYIHNI